MEVSVGRQGNLIFDTEFRVEICMSLLIFDALLSASVDACF
jgi:hypothetical protein